MRHQSLGHDATRTPDVLVEAKTELAPAEEQTELETGLRGHDFGAIRVMHDVAHLAQQRDELPGRDASIEPAGLENTELGSD